MRMLGTLLLLLAILMASVCHGGELFTQTFKAEGWSYCGLPCFYMKFPLTVPESLASGSIDSVSVMIWGTSRQGYQYLCMGSDCVTVDCWDGLLASFETSEVGSWCNPDNFHPDGVADYVAADFRPLGGGNSFAMARRMMGIEQIDCCPVRYAGGYYRAIDPQPSFDGVFARPALALRIQQVNGGPLSPLGGGCWKCYDGLAAIDSVSIAVSYNGSTDAPSSTWGSVKALYR